MSDNLAILFWLLPIGNFQYYLVMQKLLIEALIGYHFGEFTYA